MFIPTVPIAIDRVFDQSKEQFPQIDYVNIAPRAQSCADLVARPVLKRDLREIGDLDASRIHGACALSVDQGRQN